jgi:hypothetical protein
LDFVPTSQLRFRRRPSISCPLLLAAILCLLASEKPRRWQAAVAAPRSLHRTADRDGCRRDRRSSAGCHGWRIMGADADAARGHQAVDVVDLSKTGIPSSLAHGRQPAAPFEEVVFEEDVFVQPLIWSCGARPRIVDLAIALSCSDHPIAAGFIKVEEPLRRAEHRAAKAPPGRRRQVRALPPDPARHNARVHSSHRRHRAAK